jgi:hypothetical protein
MFFYFLDLPNILLNKKLKKRLAIGREREERGGERREEREERREKREERREERREKRGERRGEEREERYLPCLFEKRSSFRPIFGNTCINVFTKLPL